MWSLTTLSNCFSAVCIVFQMPVHSAFTSSTDRAYETSFRLFLAFLAYMGLALDKVNVDFLLMYLKFLVLNKFNPSYIANQLAGIKAKLKIFSIPSQIFQDEKISYFLRSLRLNTPLKASLHNIIDIALLSNIVKECDNMYMGQVYKAMYLLGFFSFLRISNLVPHAQQQFSPLKHLTPQDIFFKKDSLLYC